MAKQTFTVGQVLTAAQMTSLQQTAMGGGSTTAKTASYVLVAADAGTVVQMNSATATIITVNTALFAAGDTVQIQNVGVGVCTVTAGTATVSTSAVLALKQYDAGSLYFNSTSAALFFAADAADNTSPLTTKGDIYGFSTLNARIPIGTNNQVLTADSAEALGLKWATPASTTFSGCLYGKTTNQTLANGTTTAITFANAATYDTDSYHSTVTNNTRFTAPSGKTGYYLVYGQINYDSNATSYRTFSIKKNNGTADFIFTNGGTSFTANNNFYMILDLTAGDYLEITGQQGSGGNLDVLGSTYGTRATYFGMQYLGA